MTVATSNWVEEARAALAAIQAEAQRQREENRVENRAKKAEHLRELVGLMVGEPVTEEVRFFEAYGEDVARVTVDGYTFGSVDSRHGRYGILPQALLLWRECPDCGRDVCDEIEKPLSYAREDEDREAREARQRDQMRLDFARLLEKAPGEGHHECGYVEGDRNYRPALRVKTKKELAVEAMEAWIRDIAMDYAEQ